MAVIAIQDSRLQFTNDKNFPVDLPSLRTLTPVPSAQMHDPVGGSVPPKSAVDWATKTINANNANIVVLQWLKSLDWF